MSNKLNIFLLKGFETVLFQNKCLAFRSPANIVLCLKLKSSVMSVSIHTRPGDLYTAASCTSLYQSVCRPLSLLLKQGETILHGCGKCLSNCNGSSAFSTQEAVDPINVVILNKMWFQMYLFENRDTFTRSSCSCLLGSWRCLALDSATLRDL
jgi:hypothetical protein